MRFLKRDKLAQGRRVLALGTPYQALEQYFDFLRYLKVVSQGNGDGNQISFDVVSSLPSDEELQVAGIVKDDQTSLKIAESS